jgi:hypothetical protein
MAFPLPTAENAGLRAREVPFWAGYVISISMLVRIREGCRQPNFGALKPVWQQNGSGIQQHIFLVLLDHR